MMDPTEVECIDNDVRQLNLASAVERGGEYLAQTHGAWAGCSGLHPALA
jgi:hypothetical protein